MFIVVLQYSDYNIESITVITTDISTHISTINFLTYRAKSISCCNRFGSQINSGRYIICSGEKALPLPYRTGQDIYLEQTCSGDPVLSEQFWISALTFMTL